MFFGGDSAFGPKNIIWAVEHGHQAAISIHKRCQGLDLKQRMPRGVNLATAKMGIHEWSYSNGYDPAARRIMPHVELKKRFKKLNIEVELGFTAEQIATEVERCLNCDLQTVFTPKLCIECDACLDICPVDCLDDHAERHASASSRSGSRRRLQPDQPFFVSAPLAQTGRVMVKDENLCVHCGLCAERCPTGGLGHAEVDARRYRTRGTKARSSESVADLKKSRVNDFVLKVANVNGTGSASANSLLMKTVFRMGVPVSGKNFFPSNIQGLPTWYEIRVNNEGYVGRAGAVDMMVAMNSATYARDLAEVSPGGYLLYDSTWPRDRRCSRATTSRSSACRSRGCATSISRARARGS